MTSNNFSSLIHLYGIFNGLLLGGVFIITCSSISLFINKKTNLAKLHLAAALGFVSFGLHGQFYQKTYGSVATQVIPDALLVIGRVGAPIALLLFFYVFTKVFEIQRHQPQYKWPIRLCYLAYISVTITLLLAKTDVHTLKIIYLCMVPTTIFGLLYTAKHAKYLHWGNAAKHIFLACSILSIYMVWMISSGRFLNIPLKFHILEHVISYTLPLFFGFLLIKYSGAHNTFLNKIRKFKAQALLTDLERAADLQQLSLMYQPKVSLDTNKTCGFEALIRWNHPEKGFISPGYFIPLAEKTLLINPLTAWVISQSLKEMAPLIRQFPELSLSINFSTRNLNEKTVKHLKAELKTHKIPAKNIIIEITESTFMQESESLIKALAVLNELGCNLSLDDYGTGFSSLSHINQLALKELKIDRIFINDIESNQEHLIIVNSTIQMSKNLNLQVVAEGVETEESLELLKSLNCDIIQGYGIAKPMTAEKIESWIQTSAYHL